MVLPASHRVSRVRWYSGYTLKSFRFRLQVFHLLRSCFPTCSAVFHSLWWVYRNPTEQAPWFGLFPFRSPLLRKSIFLSLPPGTKMFQFSGFVLRYTMNSCMDTTLVVSFLIRSSRDHRLCAPTPSLSQLITTFFDS